MQRLLARGRGQDDTEEVIRHRLAVYRQRTLPMIRYYAGREELVTVDGARPVDDVSRTVLDRLEHLRRRPAAV